MNNEQWYQDLSLRNASGDYAGIISVIMQNYSETTSPLQYIYVYYCFAMALIGLGNTSAGISHLQSMLNHSKQFSLDPAEEIFVSKAQLQLTLLKGFSSCQPMFSKNDHLVAAANIWDYAAQTKDHTLAAACETVMNQWLRTNAKGRICFLPRSPQILQIEPTNNCNFRCTMCPRRKMKRATGFMDIELFRIVLDSWSNKCQTLPLEHMVFGGEINAIRKGFIKLFFMGEPLLHNSYAQMIEIAREAGCIVGIQTNGSLLTDEIACERLLKAKPHEIAFSIDGMNESTYEQVRRGSSYQAILDNVKNLYSVRERLGLSKEIHILISTIIPHVSEDAKNKANAFLKPMCQYVDDITYFPIDRGLKPVFFDSNGEIRLMEEMQNSQNKEGPSCAELLNKLNVLWNGDITPCCYDVDGVLKLGHAEDGIDRVWVGEQTVKLQNAILNNDISNFPLCRVCQKIL